MVMCCKCGKFYLFGTNYNDMCEYCYNEELKMKKYREELDLKIKKQEELERKRKKQEELKIKRALALKKVREYETEKEKRKKEYIKIMLDKPEILQLYIKILKCKSSTTFKILFWDFLLGGISTEYFTNRRQIEFDIYKSKVLRDMNKKGIVSGIEKNVLKLTLGSYIHDEDDIDEIITLKEYLSTGKVRKIEGNRYWQGAICRPTLGYVMLMNEFIDFYKIIDEFENSNELFQIYNNMKEAKIDNEIIVNKIYSLYKNLYIDSFVENLTEDGMQRIIQVENRKIVSKKYDNDYLDISSKTKLINFIVSELGDVSENERIANIASVLKVQKKMDNKLKFDIIVNIEEILKEATEKIKEKEKQNEIDDAKKERDRLLKGDFSKEREIEELSLSTDNIKDGFEFEKYVANLYRKLGYAIEKVTKKSGDQGADVVAIKNNTKYVIQAKFYNNPVGNKAVQEVVAAIGMYKADKGMVITNNTFTQSAIELAKANNIELVDGKKIEEYKKQILAKI